MSKLSIILVIVAIVFVFFQRIYIGNKAAGNIEIGETFLAENRTQEGVITTASGLQYKVLNQGDGEMHPTANSNVKVHYHGSLIDGTVFDSSVDRGQPISFGLNQVIAGWTEGVQLMVEGDKFRFYIPSSLAYGDQAPGKIPAGSLLIFDVELLAIN
ncbi:FKBP-type peptidyl-prolyl cis-trans isomerase [Psychromonas sp.]|uniref:FKBP-type peptidyl-prolyl cis-trans isomerase n=1 Tax=Psychromonas sp. TaxID=1884585 RepID=UPI0035686349